MMNETFRLPLRRLRTFGLLVGCVVAVAACGSSSTTSKSSGTAGKTSNSSSSGAGAGASGSSKQSCSGTPVTLVSITNVSAPLSQEAPEYPAGMTAAAAAVTKSCELGAPVRIVSCDDQFNPNKNAQCGREAVADKADAVLAYTGLGDIYGPIVTKAGIPILPASNTSATESTSPLSYPFGFSLTGSLGEVQLAAASGAHKLMVAPVAIPAVAFAINLLKGAAARFGMQFLTPVEIPPTATDMTPYAAQIKASGADAIMPYVGPIQMIPLLKALYADGVNGNNSHIVNSLLTLVPQYVKQLGPAINGVLASGWGMSPTQTSSPIVQQYISELAAAGQPHAPQDLDMLGLQGWAQVHALADALHSEGLTATPANIAKALSTADMPTLTQKYGLSPVDFTKNPFPAPLNKLRIFSQYGTAWRFNAAGVPQPLDGGGQISVFSKQKISH